MLFAYRFLINLILLLSPIILIFRIIKKKEDPLRFKEKIGFFSNKRAAGTLIWFHGASVGELQSVIPIIEKLEKNKNIQQILVTSNTLSSSKIIKNKKLKKVIHQFFPIDSNFLIKKFLNYWKPSRALFIDSEFWPNTILNLKERKIPIILINGRITYKTFNRWKKFPHLTKKLFSNFQISLASNIESEGFLKELNFNKVRYIGNLKYSQSINENFNFNNKRLDKIFRNRIPWCAVSTHNPEELLIGEVHKFLKKKDKRLLTIIIPRHVERSNKIKKDLEKLNLKIHLFTDIKTVTDDTDIYLINSYGKTKLFYKYCKKVFLGGSLINHGGQNPLEAARYGCSILSGPHVQNFSEIYTFLKKNKLYKLTKNKKALIFEIDFLINNKNKIKKSNNKIKDIGDQILKKTYNAVFK